MSKPADVINKQEVQGIMQCLAKGYEKTGRKPCIEDVKHMINWARQVRHESALLLILAQGDMPITVEEGDFVIHGKDKQIELSKAVVDFIEKLEGV